MIICITIVILIVVVIPNSMTLECGSISDHSNVRTISTALKLFNIDTGRYPTESEGLKVLVSVDSGQMIDGYKSGGYLEKLPDDSWGNPYHYYQYKLSSEENVAVVWTYGADNLPNGGDHNKDIVQFVTPKGDNEKLVK